MYIYTANIHIFNFYRFTQAKHRPNDNPLYKNNLIDWDLRTRLVDWLVAIHQFTKLPAEVLFPCVHIVDLFLSTNVVYETEIQLIGIVALQIAYKNECRRFINVHKLQSLLNGRHSTETIRQAELYVLDKLGFRLGSATSLSWLLSLPHIDNSDVLILSQYLIELTLLDKTFLEWPTQRIVSAGHSTALYLLYVSSIPGISNISLK